MTQRDTAKRPDFRRPDGLARLDDVGQYHKDRILTYILCHCNCLFRDHGFRFAGPHDAEVVDCSFALSNGDVRFEFMINHDFGYDMWVTVASEHDPDHSEWSLPIIRDYLTGEQDTPTVLTEEQTQFLERYWGPILSIFAKERLSETNLQLTAAYWDRQDRTHSRAPWMEYHKLKQQTGYSSYRERWEAQKVGRKVVIQRLGIHHFTQESTHGMMYGPLATTLTFVLDHCMYLFHGQGFRIVESDYRSGRMVLTSDTLTISIDAPISLPRMSFIPKRAGPCPSYSLSAVHECLTGKPLPSDEVNRHSAQFLDDRWPDIIAFLAGDRIAET